MKKVVSVVLVFLLVFTSFSIVKSTEIRDSSNFDSLSGIMDRINVSLDIAMDEESWERLYEEPYLHHKGYMRNSSGFSFDEPFFHYFNFSKKQGALLNRYYNKPVKFKDSNTNNFQSPKSKPSFSDGNIIYVDDDSECPGNGSQEWPYCKIQYGIDNATDGDTIYVFNGTYYEHVVVDKSINLTGEDRNSTVIDGYQWYGEYGDVVTIRADYVHVGSFTIRNGFYGIRLESSYNNAIDDNIITNNSKYYGIVLNSSPNNNISDNTITNNMFNGIGICSSSNNNSIAGNTITNNGGDGITLFSSSNNAVSGNTITNNLQGIFLPSSLNNVVSGNTITNNTDAGIILDDSSNNFIAGNNITYNNQDGIMLTWSYKNTISNNVIINNSRNGIYLNPTHSNIISDNTIANNSLDGIGMYVSKYTIITGNILKANGIIILGYPVEVYWNSHTIENNTLDGKPIRYYKNSNNIVVPDDAVQVIMANCKDCTIRNMNLSGGSVGIQLAFSENNLITGNTITNNTWDGIRFESSSNNNMVSGNTIVNNSNNGILLCISSNNTIVSNTIIQNHFSGIHVSGRHWGAWSPDDNSFFNKILNNNCVSNRIDGIGLYYEKCSYNEIKNNTCLDNMKGIAVRGSSNNKLVNNTCNNNQQGILLNTADYTNISDNNCSHNNIGIYLFDSTNNSIIDNHCNYSSYEGIALVKSADNSLMHNIVEHNYNGLVMVESNHNEITYNDIYDNTAIGIALQRTKGNKINYNNIYDNTGYGLAGVNCFDDARFNWWGKIIPIFFRDVLFLGWVRIFPWLLKPIDTSKNLDKRSAGRWYASLDNK